MKRLGQMRGVVIPAIIKKRDLRPKSPEVRCSSFKAVLRLNESHMT
jgi:hypothetical protein